MKIDPIIKEFLNREDIQEFINEGDIDKVFGYFSNYMDYYYMSKVDSIGKLEKQLYNLFSISGIKWEKRYQTYMFKFVSNIIDRKVNSQINGIGIISDVNFLNYNHNKDDLTNFNNATWEVKFDNGMKAIILGNKLELM